MSEMHDIDTDLNPAIDYFHTQKAMASAMGLHVMTVTQWKKRGIPPEQALEIAKLSMGKVQPFQIKPKLFKNFVYLPTGMTP